MAAAPRADGGGSLQPISVVEVSPRDGLQNEAVLVSTDAKVALLQRVVDAGLRRIEAVSFAHPRLVPTMADAEAVMQRAPRRKGVSYAGPCWTGAAWTARSRPAWTR